MDTSHHHVFVYGTLKSGGSNAAVARRAGLIRATPARLQGFRIYDLQPEGYPAVVRGPGVVYGEVLTLAGSLTEMDALEGLDLTPPMYRRIRCRTEGSGEAWVYEYARPERLDALGATWLPSGRWPPGTEAFDS